MELSKIMSEGCISFDEELNTKQEVFNYLINCLYEQKVIDSKEAFLDAVLYRESLSETGLTDGIAIPHGKASCVRKAFIAYVRLQKPIPWESIDGLPVQHIFMLAIPEQSQDDVHIKMISQLARSLIKADVIEKINEAKAAKELLEVI